MSTDLEGDIPSGNDNSIGFEKMYEFVWERFDDSRSRRETMVFGVPS